MSDQRLHDQEKVLQGLAAGDEDAFAQVFACYSHKVYAVAVKFLKSPLQAEEIVQDVFLKVWVKRAGILQVGRFDAYLFVMTRNLIIDRLKKIARETLVNSEWAHRFSEADHRTENGLRERQYDQLLQEAVRLLPPQQKQVFQLSRFQGLSQEAIAEVMQLSRLTVKTHMAKALHTIRKYLSHHLHSLLLIFTMLKMVQAYIP